MSADADKLARDMAAADTIEADKLRRILRTAAAAVEALEFHHFPVRGYDKEDILSTLQEMEPPALVYSQCLAAAESRLEMMA
jgi:hypothetical protein